MADLEALVGHAVVLQDTSLLPHWRSPENYPAAVCVPVAGNSMPLGTLWFYSDTTRDFTSEETNLVEIIAGRIAADLEREMLLTENTQSRRRGQLLDVAARWQASRLPSVSPLLEDFEVAGWTLQADGIGGDFYDWFVLADGRLAIALGDAQGRLVEAGLGAAALQAAIKSHAGYPHDAAGLLARVNETLWTTSAGDQFASLCYGLIDPASGRLEFALAGDVSGLHARRNHRELLRSNTLALGTDPETRFSSLERELKPGDSLILLSEGARNAAERGGLGMSELASAALSGKHHHDNAEGMLAKVRRLIDRGPAVHTEDMTVLVVKRRM